ncbi:GspE/PulE family protein [Clostridium botulinum]|uniref:Type II/IV secretion system protein n=1 Tax=Clostridium botulinum TaxID=1491 RepID=A0A6B4JJ31_CLOBO|nr:GspE/PulE family protein [Clostridium botulinum]EES48653.1 general secretion pathway protein [Clostridium botulinum E1 str. 'BoNT E Beluga']MBY6760449.1 type II/IV secretion system protein [Clostridium botulinum]MBY6919356.1 type II/IV secretion system protein [Clostridium botulinum]MCR1130234.1 GspE/PulE family protein [Clostridium botulinum]NFJ57004.1 type II/IV secretion system protein [Clostridium botulinum]
MLGYEIRDEAEEYLRFIYNNKIILKEISKQNYDYLRDIIFKVEDEDIESTLIYNAILRNASDIHFEPCEKEVDIRYRINGGLILVHKMLLSEYLILASKIKLKANMDISERRKPQDGKILINYDHNNYDLRISSIPVVYGEKIVIRILYSENFNYKLEDLYYSKEKIELIKKIMSLKKGLVLVNGPTGSGKSTTLYTILKEINIEDINITTLEDPVESIIPNINQMSLNKKLDINFSNGLKNILRQDPDVIMVGEVRDEETAAMSVRASITGHKVYTTIHTSTPREVFLRLEDMGIKPYLLKDSIVGIISQRLIKVLCENCKKEDNKNTYKGIKLYKSVGCSKCNYSGYESRKLISAVYFIDKEYDEIDIYKDKYCLSNIGMKDDLEKLLENGQISYENYVKFMEGEGLNEYL